MIETECEIVSLLLYYYILLLLLLLFQSGERGYLEGLASRYADLFNTHYGDVLEHLEDLRRREWEDMSPRIRVLVGTTPGTPPSEAYSPVTSGPVGGVVGQHTPQVSDIVFQDNTPNWNSTFLGCD